MSRLSSSSVSFVDPLSCYYTSSSMTPFGNYHPDPDHQNSMKDCFDLKFYSSSFPSNQFLMHHTPIFNSSSTSSSSPSSSYSSKYQDFNSSPIRRVFSTGDLQVSNFSYALITSFFISNCFFCENIFVQCEVKSICFYYKQGMNGLQASSKEISTQANETGTVLCKVGRYSTEERKERIERYRSKRQQRNFQKKITVCPLVPFLIL